MVDPVEQAAPLEGVVELARAVRGEDDDRPPARPHRSELGDRDLEVGQHLEQEGLELLVGAVDLVDEQDDGVVGLDRLEQRPADEEVRPEELLLGDGPLLCGPDMQQLTRVVPLVDRVRDVQPLVALEPDQPGSPCVRECLRRLRLAHARLALEKDGLLERGGEEERRRETAVRQVVGAAQGGLELVHGPEVHAERVVAGHGSVHAWPIRRP